MYIASIWNKNRAIIVTATVVIIATFVIFQGTKTEFFKGSFSLTNKTHFLPNASLPCTVMSSFPYTVNQPGNYCLDQNHYVQLDAFNNGGLGNYLVPAIYILADDVTIDLQGYSLINSGPRFTGVNTSPQGVLAEYARNVVIKNGVLKDFDYGIVLYTTTNAHVEKIEIYDVQHTSIQLLFANITRISNVTIRGNSSNGIRVTESKDTELLSNTISGLFWGIIFGPISANVYPTGRVVNNTVCATHAAFTYPEPLPAPPGSNFIEQGNQWRTTPWC